jgi:protein-L-isoaspartate O-methyltransferase
MPFRLSFTLAQADYQQLLQPQPAFPQAQFAMAADQRRLSAYSAALKAAITRAAAAKQQQKQSEVRGSDKSNAAAAVEVSVLDVGCGSGVLSLLAAAAAKTVTLPATAPATAAAAAAAGTAEGSVMPTCPAQQLTQAPAADPAAAAAAAAAAVPGIPVGASVVGVELVAPLAAAALRNVGLNGCCDSVSIVHGDAAMLERGAQVPSSGVDVVVFDCFDAGGSHLEQQAWARCLLFLCVLDKPCIGSAYKAAGGALFGEGKLGMRAR